MEKKDVSNILDVLENFCEDWAGLQYCELSVLLSATLALSQVHQVNHWQASGTSSYGDHLLFERVYKGTYDEVDRIAERIVGLASPDLVNAAGISAQMNAFVQMYSTGKESVEESLSAEMIHAQIIDAVSESLERQDLLTYGVDNLLADLAETHEEHIYLLKQRST